MTGAGRAERLGRAADHCSFSEREREVVIIQKKDI